MRSSFPFNVLNNAFFFKKSCFSRKNDKSTDSSVLWWWLPPLMGAHEGSHKGAHNSERLSETHRELELTDRSSKGLKTTFQEDRFITFALQMRKLRHRNVLMQSNGKLSLVCEQPECHSGAKEREEAVAGKATNRLHKRELIVLGCDLGPAALACLAQPVCHHLSWAL